MLRLACYLGPAYITTEEFENVTITGHFGFMVEENSGRKITLLSRCYRVRKTAFSKRVFDPSTLNCKAAALPNFSAVKSVFEKFRFGDGLVWTVGVIVFNDSVKSVYHIKSKHRLPVISHIY